MKIEITRQKKNPLFLREELEFRVKDAKLTPSRGEIRERLSATMNKDNGLVVVRKVKQSFGFPEANGIAFVYDNKEALDKTEAKYMKARNFGKTKEGAEAAGGDAKTEPEGKAAEEVPLEKEEKKEGE